MASYAASYLSSYFLVPFIASTGIKYLLQSLRISFVPTKTVHTIDSPLQKLLPTLDVEEQNALPYPPNALPGGRNVDTPYGNIRVYEWGPEDGRKVLLVHGISTPCISLAQVAETLAQNGCRVMTFDLFGRGYSSMPDPATHPQNAELFTTQILLVLASSPIPWTGKNSFDLIGYSLGGGISAAFTSYHPTLVNSLTLIAPSGLIRSTHITLTSRLLYGSYLPTPLVTYLIKRRLTATSAKAIANPEATPVDAAAAELPHEADPEMAQSHATLFKDRPSVSVTDAVVWQATHHAGFVPAFISSIQHAPIRDEHERWRVIGRRLAVQRANPGMADQGLHRGKVLMILGSEDGVIVADEVREDAEGCFGAEGVVVKVLATGHDLPIVMSGEVAGAILEFWNT